VCSDRDEMVDFRPYILDVPLWPALSGSTVDKLNDHVPGSDSDSDLDELVSTRSTNPSAANVQAPTAHRNAESGDRIRARLYTALPTVGSVIADDKNGDDRNSRHETITPLSEKRKSRPDAVLPADEEDYQGLLRGLETWSRGGTGLSLSRFLQTMEPKVCEEGSSREPTDDQRRGGLLWRSLYIKYRPCIMADHPDLIASMDKEIERRKYH
jgi:hypothetical protein